MTPCTDLKSRWLIHTARILPSMRRGSLAAELDLQPRLARALELEPEGQLHVPRRRPLHRRLGGRTLSPSGAGSRALPGYRGAAGHRVTRACIELAAHGERLYRVPGLDAAACGDVLFDDLGKTYPRWGRSERARGQCRRKTCAREETHQEIGR